MILFIQYIYIYIHSEKIQEVQGIEDAVVGWLSRLLTKATEVGKTNFNDWLIHKVRLKSLI